MEEYNNIEVASPTVINEAWRTSINVDAYISSLPYGYRFGPTDRELIQHYLQKKIRNEPLPMNRFRHINIYQHHPEYLTGNYTLLRESEWYFFSPRIRKYRNGNRPNRVAGHGFWKATGSNEEIKDAKGKVIGYKRTLSFYRGTPKEFKRTNWGMHEYVDLSGNIAPPNDPKANGDMKLNDCVVCKIYLKKEKDEKTNAEPADSDQEQGVMPVTNVTSHAAFSDQSIQPDNQHPSPLIISESSNVSSPAFSDQSVLPHYQDQSPVFGKSSFSSVAFKNTFGEPKPPYYESFQNGGLSSYSVSSNSGNHQTPESASFQDGALSKYSVSTNSVNHQTLESAHTSHAAPEMNAFASPSSMQGYSRKIRTILDCRFADSHSSGQIQGRFAHTSHAAPQMNYFYSPYSMHGYSRQTRRDLERRNNGALAGPSTSTQLPLHHAKEYDNSFDAIDQYLNF